jgi:hypothetical protein
MLEQPAGTTVEGRRRQRLAEELFDEAHIVDLSELELEELTYAYAPPVHEQRSPSYGAIIASEQSWPNQVDHTPPAMSVKPVVVKVGDVDRGRLFADGRNSFILRQAGEVPKLVTHHLPFGDELSLANLSDSGATVIQRTADGTVRLLRHQRIATRASGRWQTKPTAVAYAPPVRDAVPPANEDVALAALNLCVHVLSSAHVGATVVMAMKEGHSLTQINYDHAFQPPVALNVRDREAHAAIRSALSQLDRACVIAGNGEVVTLGARLMFGEESNDVTSPGGTRHNSALRFSAEEKTTLVFVVSEDGPVTVFRGGEIVASTTQARRLTSVIEACNRCGYENNVHDDDEVEFESNDPDCPDCDGRGYVYVPHTFTQKF